MSAVLPAAENRGYRHGLMPTAGSEARNFSPRDLHYRGGNGGIGVTIGKPRVYLVFWGSQWGTQSTDGNGYATFTGDAAGVAVDLQAFFAGLGTGNETWSGVMTQYCDGIAIGATRCSSRNPHVGYPLGGALAGVWEDNSRPAPAQATGHQIALEAVNAAVHFGNTTTQSNINSQYLVISPSGTNPDNYMNSAFCAWHDYTGDPLLDGGGSVPGPLVAFTNLPYAPDAGPGCGAGLVNPGNQLDGVTILAGHEYAETITDQFPSGGWTADDGAEAADLCAWKMNGPGHLQNLVLPTGTFAVQGIWSNLSNFGQGNCSIARAIVK